MYLRFTPQGALLLLAAALLGRMRRSVAISARRLGQRAKCGRVPSNQSCRHMRKESPEPGRALLELEIAGRIPSRASTSKCLQRILRDIQSRGRPHVHVDRYGQGRSYGRSKASTT